MDSVNHFEATIEIIGVNPFVFIPNEILQNIIAEAGKNTSPIPIHGTVNGKLYTQTLVKYAGEWRLYINTKMLKDSPKRIGESVQISVAFDGRDRSLPLHPKLKQALENDPPAKKVFESLTPSLQHEINRYISNLKTEETVNKNVVRAIKFLHGKESFVGRTLPEVH